MHNSHQCLLDSKESVVMLIDFQPRVLQEIKSHAVDLAAQNATKLAKAAKVFGIPVVATTIDAKGFGPLLPELHTLLDQPVIDRTSVSAWENREFRACVAGFGRKKIVIAGAWTSVSVCSSAISAIAEGYEIYVVADACGDVSTEAHERALHRLLLASI